MLPCLLFRSLLAGTALCGLVSTASIPTTQDALEKRQLCVEVTPGAFTLTPSTLPFVICDETPGEASFIFQNDGDFVVNNASQLPVWTSRTGGHTCSGNNCTLAFQADGNLVLYYNRAPIWYTGTGASIGKSLIFQNARPYLGVINSQGAYAWESGF